MFAATNPDYSLIDSSFQGQAIGSVVDAFLFPVDQTDAPSIAIPEPHGLAGVGLALMAILKGAAVSAFHLRACGERARRTR